MDLRCILPLCDPDGLSARDAIRFARKVSRVEPDLALSLCAYLAHLSQAEDLDARAVQRTLELLYAVSGPASFAGACERMIRTGDEVVSGLFRWLSVSTPRRVRRRPV
jgi:hypothetical protein